VNAKRAAVWGLGIGFLLTAGAMMVWWILNLLMQVPFPPFVLFEWIARVLPGPLVTFGIDLLVDVLIALRVGDLSSTAKLAEGLMAVALVLAIGALAGAAVFGLWRRGAIAETARRNAALVAGLVAGGLLALVQLAVSSFDETWAITAFFYVVVTAGWGLLLAWSYREMGLGQPATTAPPPAAIHDGIEVMDRRSFLVRMAGATATILLVGAGLETLLRLASPESRPAVEGPPLPDLPNADAALSPAPGTRPELTSVSDHYRIDINLQPITVNEETWTLPVTGLVANPASFTLADLREQFTSVSAFVTLSCISNRVGGSLIGTTKWTGVPIAQILDVVQPTPQAEAMRIIGGDGFDEVVALADLRADDRIMLVYAWNDEPLTEGHGFPLRIYLPDRYGMKQPKWITGLEFIPAWEEGYWVRRGWDRDAFVRATAVVDTVAIDSAYRANDEWLVPIGGIAYAGAQQISAVELQVDEGPWVPAALRDPLSDLSWVIWRYDWPFQPGAHTFRVRCVEGDGTPQIEAVAGARPSGATGWHAKAVTLPSQATFERQMESAGEG
jgi:DMSO/TMAO reductase YedYZ molybdopterin-dependent catalytic subunit